MVVGGGHRCGQRKGYGPGLFAGCWLHREGLKTQLCWANTEASGDEMPQEWAQVAWRCGEKGKRKDDA